MTTHCLDQDMLLIAGARTPRQGTNRIRQTTRLVAERDAGGVAPRVRRPRLVDEFLPKIEEWVEQSKGKIRADVAHDKLFAMDFTGSERSSRRAVAAIKRPVRSAGGQLAWGKALRPSTKSR
jgi:hypothetical protein